MNTTPDRQIPVDTLIARAEATKRGLTRTEARALDQALSAETLPEGVYAPITTAIPTSVPPLAYVLHKWSKLCLSCGALHCYSDVFALNHLRGNWGKFIRNMTPISRPEWNVPLQVHELAPKTIPFCHECLDLAQAHISMLPSPPVPQAITGTAPAGAPASTPEAKRQQSSGMTPQSKKFTSSDDLLI